jgi:hypothetical protein
LWGLFQNVFQVFRLGAGNVFQVSRSDALFMFILDLFNDAFKYLSLYSVEHNEFERLYKEPVVTVSQLLCGRFPEGKGKFYPITGHEDPEGE